MTPPERYWRSYTDEPLPSPQEALAAPLRAFPSWFLRIECDRCGKVRMLNEAHVTNGQRRMLLRDFLVRARHEGCGGRAAKASAAGRCGGSCCTAGKGGIAMGDEEQLAVLKQGAAAWNGWREKAGDIVVYLRGVSLTQRRAR
jgi:hypothetical protein